MNQICARGRNRIGRVMAWATRTGGGMLLAFMVGWWVSADARADFWNGPTHYLHVRSGMPDLDQQRWKPPFCALPPFSSLPTPGGPCAFLHPGGMHCGPASGVNLYIFAANHGYPGLLPAAQLGDIWRDPAWFCQATAHIGTLGVWSGWTLAGGTSTAGMMHGLNRAFRVARQPHLVASHYLATGGHGMNLNQLAATGIAGSIVMVAYGHYQVVGFTGPVPVVKRNGGHFVVMTGAYRNDPICLLRVRDPADDGCNPVLPTQAEYQHHVYNAVDGWVRIFAPGLPYRWMTRIFPEGTPPAFGIGSTLSLLDGMTFISARRGIARAAPALAGEPPEFFTVVPSDPWGEGAPTLVCEPLDLGAPILDAANHPDGRGVIGIIEVDAAGRGAPIRAIVHVDPGTRQSQTLAELEGIDRMVIGRNRAVYAAGGDLLHRVDLPIEAESPRPGGGEEDAGPPPAQLTLPFEIGQVEYDDLNDLVLVLAADSTQLALVAPDLQSEPEVLQIPDAADPQAGGVVASNPLDGVIWFASPGSSTLLGLAPPRKRAGAPTLEIVDEFNLPLPKGATILDINFLDEDEMIVSTSDGGSFHIRRAPPEADSADWFIEEDEPFELPCALDRLVIDRGRGNFVPGEHDDDGYDNLDPGLLIPGIPVPDPACPGDLDMDGVVNASDLGILLSAWGPVANIFLDPADLNSDGSVDGGDLGVLLGNWGICPP